MGEAPVPREERWEGWIVHEPRVDHSTSPFVRELSREDRLLEQTLDVGQTHISSGISIGQPLVIEPEQVQDRGVQVVDVHGVFDGPVAEWPWAMPGFTSPPASQSENPLLLWSRPSAFRPYSARPNSPPQITN
jgi:hypothetical protein